MRMTRVKSDTRTRPREHFAPPDPAIPDRPGGEGTVAGDDLAVPTVDPDPVHRPVEEATASPLARPDGQRALRTARRQRRRLTVACALVVAVCLALTLLIVDLSRSRTNGADALLSPPSLRLSGTGPVLPAVPFSVGSRPASSTESPGATAPEGGNR